MSSKGSEELLTDINKNRKTALLRGHGEFGSGFSDALVKNRYEEAPLSGRSAFEEILSWDLAVPTVDGTYPIHTAQCCRCVYL